MCERYKPLIFAKTRYDLRCRRKLQPQFGQNIDTFVPLLGAALIVTPFVYPGRVADFVESPKTPRCGFFNYNWLKTNGFNHAYPVYTQDRYRWGSAGQDDHPRRGFWV